MIPRFKNQEDMDCYGDYMYDRMKDERAEKASEEKKRKERLEKENDRSP